MFAKLQSDFTQALFDAERAPPAEIMKSDADGPLRRFNIYRNNVAVSLLDALAARFPVTQQLVGPEFFRNMTRLFIAAHPPSSPVMMFYGEEFPDFIAAFEPAGDLAYLPDVARLEAARTRAYHAEDATPLTAGVLRSISAQDLARLHVGLHPSIEIISSPHPIVTIWAMHEGLRPLAPITDWHGEDALVVRPSLDVDLRCLPPGGAVFLRALQQGRSLTAAAAVALTSDPAFDLGVNLAGVFSAGLAIALSIMPPKDS